MKISVKIAEADEGRGGRNLKGLCVYLFHDEYSRVPFVLQTNQEQTNQDARIFITRYSLPAKSTSLRTIVSVLGQLINANSKPIPFTPPLRLAGNYGLLSASIRCVKREKSGIWSQATEMAWRMLLTISRLARVGFGRSRGWISLRRVREIGKCKPAQVYEEAIFSCLSRQG